MSKSLAIGVSQTGKSTFALWKALQSRKQTVIWDANEVFISIVRSPVYTPDDLFDAIKKGEPVIVYDAVGITDRHEEFERFAAVLECFDNHSLLVDEAGDVQRANDPNNGLDRLYRRSGRRNNDIIETTHKATDIATLNRTLTTDTYLFAMPNRKSRKIISDEFSEEAAELSARLPDYVYIHFHNRTGKFQVVNDPTKWYINLDKLLPERKIIPAEKQTNSWEVLSGNETEKQARW
jgi:hypothetical protein